MRDGSGVIDPRNGRSGRSSVGKTGPAMPVSEHRPLIAIPGLVVGSTCDKDRDRRYLSPDSGATAMPIIDEEERPKKKLVHEIGQDLALLSVEELRDRVALLKEEIARLEAALASKQASRTTADQFFKK
jgi:uncharacterized small protein (DUF1192 family)